VANFSKTLLTFSKSCIFLKIEELYLPNGYLRTPFLTNYALFNRLRLKKICFVIEDIYLSDLSVFCKDQKLRQEK